jgi:nicotinamide-nucleotide amidase
VRQRQFQAPVAGKGGVEVIGNFDLATSFPPRLVRASLSLVQSEKRFKQGGAMNSSDLQLSGLAGRVGKHLLATQRRVATAESCTGGWIAKALTDIAGSSQWVVEGFVTYSNEAKIRTLGVPLHILESRGAVSEATARAMAAGALTRAQTQLAVAVTGIAGPGGAVPGKPVGTVWLAWAVQHGKRIEVTTELRHFRGDRESVRRKTVRAALLGLLRR